jgi:hypothetical protein
MKKVLIYTILTWTVHDKIVLIVAVFISKIVAYASTCYMYEKIKTFIYLELKIKLNLVLEQEDVVQIITIIIKNSYIIF